jgi:hypothetical protein
VARGQTAVLFSRKHPEVARQLELGQEPRATPKWRLLRAVLLALTWVAPATVNVVTRFMQWVERRRPRRLDRYYDMALDYYYWVGVRGALAKRARDHR